MKFTPPTEINGKKVVDVVTENSSSGTKNNQNPVVFFFVGDRLPFPAVQLAVRKIWNLKKEVTIKLCGELAFIFEFSYNDDSKQVLKIRSFFVSKKLFTVRSWSHSIEKPILI